MSLIPLARLLGMPVVMRHIGRDYERDKWGPVARRVLRLGEAVGIRFANSVVCITDEIAERVQATYGREVIVIPNAVEQPTSDAGSEILTSLGLESGRYVLGVGRERDYPGRYWKRLLLAAQTAGNVMLPGLLNGAPLHELYSHAGLFVLPSTHEGLSFSALEALAYGLPVLLSDIPGNRALALGSECYFPPDDAAGLAARIDRQLCSPEARATLRASSGGVAARYRVEEVASQTLKVYRQVAAQKRRRPRASPRTGEQRPS